MSLAILDPGRPYERAGIAVVAGGAALVVGELVGERPAIAGLLALLPFLAYLITVVPDWILVLLMLSLPFNFSLAGTNGSLQVAGSDVLLALALFVVLARRALHADRDGVLHRLRPIAVPVGVYAAAISFLIVLHPSVHSAVNCAQRFELIAIPLLLGSIYGGRPLLSRALLAYVIGATGLGIAFTLTGFGGTAPDVLGVDKNPAGQFMASAVLILLVYHGIASRWRLLILPLGVGLIASQSRGALVGLLVALAVLVLLQQGSRARTILFLSLLAIGLVATFALLPSDQQHRLLDTNSSTDYALKYRATYRSDAIAIIKKHELDGVGVGNYLAGNAYDLTLTSDPHNVVLLELAEGGIGLGIAFFILQGGTIGWLVTHRKRVPLATLAVVAQVSVLTHAQFDTYWVRGTPVLGWFLVGAAVATRLPREAPDVPELEATPV